MKRFHLYLLVFTAYLYACSTPPSQETVSTRDYFDLRGFMERQIASLTAIHPVVSKTMKIGDSSEQISTSSVDWKKELDLFLQADLNKPALKGSYDSFRPDSVTFEYKLKPNEDLPVEYLKIVLDSISNEPAHLEARILTKNKLYESRKNLQLECGREDGTWILKSYQISGYQELLFTDRKIFQITAILSY